ncbi:MAG: hypothetical protein NC393_10240 [Clostridium sp.]|nr:hypothetical protein [Clostridium sp.]MCM1207481.1 hypothetical protein [Ruminococcus sp.]
MCIIKKRRYYFTDTSIAVDTVIAYIMAAAALLIEISGVICSIATRGHAPELFGLLYIIAIILSVVGGIFAMWGNKAEEGGVRGKRISILLNIISFVIPLAIIIL